jgi:hypothetical protein
VGEATMANTHKVQEGDLGSLVVANNSREILVGSYKLEEVIEIPCSDLLVSHQWKCEYVWLT